MTVRCFAFLALLVLAACGESATPAEEVAEGYRALGSEDHAHALESFESALRQIGADTAHPEFLAAKLGTVEAWTAINPERAKDEFLELTRSQPSRVTDRDFSLVGSRLGEAGGFEQAIDVVSAGIEAHPESPHLIALRDKLGDQARATGSEDALEALRGIGYLGE